METKEQKEEIKEVDTDLENPDFTGEYWPAVGRRKTAVAQVRLFDKGKGLIVVNQKKASQYFKGEMMTLLNQPLKAVSKLRDFNFSVLVKGGGRASQAEAVRHGISRALLNFNEEWRDLLKVNNLLTRDKRQKERKKPGLKGARKRPQWSKR